MDNGKHRMNELAPCGVYCGACPSFGKSCKGCGSNDLDQKRPSKFCCKIRSCCYHDHQLDFCIECAMYPCSLMTKKLFTSHRGDLRYTYRHEIPHIFAQLKWMSLDQYLEFQKKRWKCNSCGGTIHFYHYKCDTCGKEQIIK